MAGIPDFEPLVCEDAGSAAEPAPGRGADSRPVRKIAGACTVAAVLGLVLYWAQGSDGIRLALGGEDRHAVHNGSRNPEANDVVGLSEDAHIFDHRRCTENGKHDEDCCAEKGTGGCMEGLEYSAGSSCWPGAVRTLCSSGAANPAACTESTRLDDDCCAMPGDGGCEPGYRFHPGRPCSDDGAVFTVCVRDPTLDVQQERSSRQKSKYAFSVVMYGNDIAQLMLVRVLARSLRTASLRVGKQPSDFVVMIPFDDYMVRYQDLLEGDGLIVKQIQKIPLPVNAKTLRRWRGVMDKLQAWTLTEYEAVAQLDNDMLFAGREGGVDPEDVFRLCGVADMCMTIDFMERKLDSGLELNAGTIVLKPSMSTFESLREAASRDRHKYYFPEQQFLSNYFEDPKNHKSVSALETTWNSCSLDGDELHDAFLHFCGPVKPTDQPISFKYEEVSTQFVNLKPGYVMWYKQLNLLDKCTAKSSEKECQDCGHGCHWCAKCNYCIQKDIECCDKVFCEKDLSNVPFLVPR